MSAVNSAPSMAVAPAPAATRLLEVRGLNSYYGDSHILFDVSLRVERNEVVALLGRNGAGKSTTLKSLMGVVTPRAGSVLLDEPLAGMSPRERVETVKLLKSISRGRTMIIIDHDMDSLFELAERVTVLQEGRVLVEGTPDEIKNSAAVQEAYLGGVHGVLEA